MNEATAIAIKEATEFFRQRGIDSWADAAKFLMNSKLPKWARLKVFANAALDGWYPGTADVNPLPYYSGSDAFFADIVFSAEVDRDGTQTDLTAANNRVSPQLNARGFADTDQPELGFIMADFDVRVAWPVFQQVNDDDGTGYSPVDQMVWLAHAYLEHRPAGSQVARYFALSRFLSPTLTPVAVGAYGYPVTGEDPVQVLARAATPTQPRDNSAQDVFGPGMVRFDADVFRVGLIADLSAVLPEATVGVSIRTRATCFAYPNQTFPVVDASCASADALLRDPGRRLRMLAQSGRLG